MYIVITPAGNKMRKEDNLKRARANIAGTDLVIKYSEKARKAYLKNKEEKS